MACRNPNFSTQHQNFLTESYNKERDARLKWHFKCEKSESKKPKQFDVFRRKIEEGSKPSEALLQRLPTIVGETRYNKKKANLVDMMAERATTSLNPGAEMRPVTPKTKSGLYDGFTKEGRGRYQYLEKRYKKIPEQKYDFPLLSSWEYGWRLGDVIKKEEIKKPAHGRTKIVADTFYTRNGISRDTSLKA
ncbi:protein ATP6V1FNB-like [Haliotis rubra]|uniref:protein ATP6V1FNB-like n=1 Tax=Haliotis rubra TaxID=36100 RepID=UPI001EE5004B|nr:protein ATP6V1FNB-like [Haliotis rubra]